MLQALFTAHPATVTESYGEHWRTANSFAGALLVGGIVCLVHAWLPFLFTKTGSGIITRLHDRLVTHRTKRPAVVSEVQELAQDAA